MVESFLQTQHKQLWPLPLSVWGHLHIYVWFYKNTDIKTYTICWCSCQPHFHWFLALNIILLLQPPKKEKKEDKNAAKFIQVSFSYYFGFRVVSLNSTKCNISALWSGVLLFRLHLGSLCSIKLVPADTTQAYWDLIKNKKELKKLKSNHSETTEGVVPYYETIVCDMICHSSSLCLFLASIFLLPCHLPPQSPHFCMLGQPLSTSPFALLFPPLLPGPTCSSSPAISHSI